MIKEENSRRTLFKKAAAAMGVVVTAVVSAKSLISASWASKNYSNDDAVQVKMLAQNQLVAMTDDEKNQRLNDILNCHKKELS